MRTLNSRGFKFANISENKVLANNSEFTVTSSTYELYMYMCTYRFREAGIFLQELYHTIGQLWVVHAQRFHFMKGQEDFQ